MLRESRRWIAGALILTGTAWPATQSPQRISLRTASLGGAVAGLADDDLVLYYNPAALAFARSESDAQKKPFDEEDLEIRPKQKVRLHVGLPSVQLRLPAGSPTTISNLKTALGLFVPTAGSLLPSPYDQVAANLGLGDLFSLPGGSGLSLSGAGIFTNGALSATAAAVRNLGLSFGLETDLLNLRGEKFGLRIDDILSGQVGTPATQSLLPIVPIPTFTLRNDLNLQLGFATLLNTPVPLALGFSPKFFVRGEVNADTDAKVFALLADPTGALAALPALATPAALTGGGSLGNASNYLKVGWGAGLDVGAMMQPATAFTVGLDVRDAFTLVTWAGAGNEVLAPAVDLGVSYAPRLSFGGFFEDPVFCAGFADLFGRSGIDFYGRMGAGAEFGTFFDALRLRVGIYQGWTSFSGRVRLNASFLSKVPFVKLFFPKEFFWPLFWPRSFDTEGMMDFVRRNPVMFAAGWVMRFVSIFDFDLEGGAYNQARLSATADWQALLSLKWGVRL